MQNSMNGANENSLLLAPVDRYVQRLPASFKVTAIRQIHFAARAMIQ
jgi:hypothetical protein